jgi:hypothetical protein
MSEIIQTPDTIAAWLKANLPDRNRDLSGGEARALLAAHAVLELYAHVRSPGVLVAFGRIVREVDESKRFMFYHLIAMVMDWNDRTPVWYFSGLEYSPEFGRCEYEPS